MGDRAVYRTPITPGLQRAIDHFGREYVERYLSRCLSDPAWTSGRR